MLLTALMAPVAVGATLLPVGSNAIATWVTGFISLGMVKFSLNVISGLVAVAMVQVGPDDILPIALVLGLLSPILSLGIAAGGGMALFNGLTSASGMITGFVAGGAGSAAAQLGSLLTRKG